MNNDHRSQLASEELYQFLCDKVVGSEKVVRYRRLYFKVIDEIFDTKHTSLISSGSKAEGLDLPGSDVDLMALAKDMKIYEHPSNRNSIVMDTENAQPGFVLLKISETLRNQLPCVFIYSEHGYLMSNKEWKELVLSGICFLSNITKEILTRRLFHIQGPSIACPYNDLDLVFCFQCKTWPTIARPWLVRNRSSGWPTTALIEDAVYYGVLVVPVGSKCSTDEDNSSEWRLSFSLPEKVLVHSFNHTQLLCYALLKIILKEIINKDQNLTKLLCSYYIKTLLFWVFEEVNQSFWTVKNLLVGLRLCIKRLRFWIFYKYIPNYFMPEHNLIDGKLSNSSRDRLNCLLTLLLSPKGWKCLLSASSLQSFKFGKYMPRDTYTDNNINEMCKAIYPCLQSSMSNFNTALLNKAFARAVNHNIPKSAKNLYVMEFFPYFSRIAAEIVILESKAKNRNFYKRYKKCLSYLLIGNFGDAVAGWLVLAAFFYTNEEYQKALPVLRIASKMLNLGLLYWDWLSPLLFVDFARRKNSYYTCYSKSFLKRYRYEVANTDTFICTEFKSVLQHQDLSADFWPTVNIFLQFLWHCPPPIILHYLTFLCHLKKKNNRKSNLVLDILSETVDNFKYPNHISRFVSYMYVKKAYELSLEDTYCPRNEYNLSKILETLRELSEQVVPIIFSESEQDIVLSDIQL